MTSIGVVAIVVLALIGVGCATVAGPDTPPPASVGGEWVGFATVGPKIGCCFGSSGNVRLQLDQKGTAVFGSLEGVGFRGRISARVTAQQLSGSCTCATSSLEASVPIEGAISGDEMVFRLGDSRMTLNRRV